MARRHNPHLTTWLVLMMVLATACSGPVASGQANRQAVRSKDIVMVTARAGDSLSSLAARYLNDPHKAYRIAQFNQIEKVQAGQRVIIPLRPLTTGGLTASGYQTVPVLVYRRISTGNTGKSVVSRKAFAEQMAYLKKNGYQTIDPDDLAAFINLKGQIPPKAVMITFDGADRSVYNLALPILDRHKMVAAVFVSTENVGRPTTLSWPMLKTLAGRGFIIGSQGIDGKNLTVMGNDTSLDRYLKGLNRELVSSKRLIEAKTGRPCRYFAYPQGQTNDLLIALLKKHRYQAAFTLQRGTNPFFIHNFKIRRTLITGRTTLDRFKRQLSTFQQVALP